MICELERAARALPEAECFRFFDAGAVDEHDAARCDRSGTASERALPSDAGALFSLGDVRLLAVSLAQMLEARGAMPGDAFVVDAPNCPAYPIMLAAAGYGGFTLVAMNNRLAAAEKRERLEGISAAEGLRVAASFDEAELSHALGEVRALLEEPDERARADADAACRAARFDEGARAVVMFTSGTTGASKAAVLTWKNLCGSARSANDVLGCAGAGADGSTLWQATLPLYHVGGLQIVVRSMVAVRPFLLYRRFDAQRVLADAARFGATHVSVVDKMLRDLLDAGDASSKAACALRAYRCLLLGGAAVNPVTLERARKADARVWASYGMTETSSALAAALISSQTDGFRSGDLRLSLLPGYRARIVGAKEGGFGALAVAGPGVIDGYANASCPRTPDGLLVTGDTAALVDGLLVLRERTGDMFVSGGENVYPAQICVQLLAVPGVADAHVYGVADATWGRRPVALVERDSTAAGVSPWLAQEVRRRLEGSLSRISRPERVIALAEFPRSGIGKTDRRALERIDAQRIDVVDVRFHRFELSFAQPFATARGILEKRATIIVEVRDAQGRTGFGECVAFETDWYLPETLADDERVLRETLAPYACAEAFACPEDAYDAFASLPEAAPFPMARAALESALWDLRGKIEKKPFWQLIGGVRKAYPDCSAEVGRQAERLATEGCAVAVPVGAVVGRASVEETVAQVRRLFHAGYRRVKLKIAPGDAARVSAVRKAVPDVAVSLDANQSFTEADMPELQKIDAMGATWIEEPLAFKGFAADRRDPAAAEARFERLARLQRKLATPICLDESFFTIEEARMALAYPELRCFAIKVAKFGGVTGSLAFARDALAVGARVWMGGMYDTGISKRMHAAFETIPGISDPGDLGSVARYFGCDVAAPPHDPRGGAVVLNDAAHPFGIGCDLAAAFHDPASKQRDL